MRKEQADARFRGAVLAREATGRDLADARQRLDGLLRAHGRDSENPVPRARADGADPTGSEVLQRATQNIQHWHQMLLSGQTE